MAVLAADRRQSRGLRLTLLGAGVAVVIAHAIWSVDHPWADLAVAAVGVVVCCPPVARGVLVAVVAIGPTLNPPVVGLGSGTGSGRIYVVQAVLLLVILAGLNRATRNGMHESAAVVVVLVLGIVALLSVGRPHAGLAWIYRPLQIFLVAFAVRSLYSATDASKLLAGLAWGATVGCALATAHALLPSFDPFRRSRPTDIPFVSAIGTFERATGAFTYPNNLGTFAAFAVLLGAACLMFGRPMLPRLVAWALVCSASSALVLSGSRAAGLGLVAGLVYLTIQLAPRRRLVVVCAELLAGVALVVGVLSSPSALDVARERLDSAAGTSLSLRLEGSAAAVDAWRSSPWIGTGSNEGRTDNFWLLYLSQGGVVGAVLFVALARTTLRPRHPKAYPELWMAAVLALCCSGLLQDSLGQTLTTWFSGALLGMCALRPGEAEEGGTWRRRNH